MVRGLALLVALLVNLLAHGRGATMRVPNGNPTLASAPGCVMLGKTDHFGSVISTSVASDAGACFERCMQNWVNSGERGVRISEHTNGGGWNRQFRDGDYSGPGNWGLPSTFSNDQTSWTRVDPCYQAKYYDHAWDGLLFTLGFNPSTVEHNFADWQNDRLSVVVIRKETGPLMCERAAHDAPKYQGRPCQSWEFSASNKMCKMWTGTTRDQNFQGDLSGGIVVSGNLYCKGSDFARVYMDMLESRGCALPDVNLDNGNNLGITFASNMHECRRACRGDCRLWTWTAGDQRCYFKGPGAINKVKTSPGLISGARDCHTCAPGFAIDSTKTTPDKCEVCPAGTRSDKVLNECKPCGLGEWASAQSDICTMCPAGTRQDRASSNSPGHSASDCVSCPKGYTQPNKGSTSCSPCPEGTYSDKEGTTAALCTPCPAGRTHYITGATSAESCTFLSGPWSFLSYPFNLNHTAPIQTLGESGDSKVLYKTCVEACESLQSESNPCRGFLLEDGFCKGLYFGDFERGWAPPGGFGMTLGDQQNGVVRVFRKVAAGDAATIEDEGVYDCLKNGCALEGTIAGTCLSRGLCVCRGGYYGPDCSQQPPTPDCETWLLTRSKTACDGVQCPAGTECVDSYVTLGDANYAACEPVSDPVHDLAASLLTAKECFETYASTIQFETSTAPKGGMSLGSGTSCSGTGTLHGAGMQLTEQQCEGRLPKTEEYTEVAYTYDSSEKSCQGHAEVEAVDHVDKASVKCVIFTGRDGVPVVLKRSAHFLEAVTDMAFSVFVKPFGSPAAADMRIASVQAASEWASKPRPGKAWEPRVPLAKLQSLQRFTALVASEAICSVVCPCGSHAQTAEGECTEAVSAEEASAFARAVAACPAQPATRTVLARAAACLVELGAAIPDDVVGAAKALGVDVAWGWPQDHEWSALPVFGVKAGRDQLAGPVTEALTGLKATVQAAAMGTAGSIEAVALTMNAVARSAAALMPARDVQDILAEAAGATKLVQETAEEVSDALEALALELEAQIKANLNTAIVTDEVGRAKTALATVAAVLGAVSVMYTEALSAARLAASGEVMWDPSLLPRRPEVGSDDAGIRVLVQAKGLAASFPAFQRAIDQHLAALDALKGLARVESAHTLSLADLGAAWPEAQMQAKEVLVQALAHGISLVQHAASANPANNLALHSTLLPMASSAGLALDTLRVLLAQVIGAPLVDLKGAVVKLRPARRLADRRDLAGAVISEPRRVLQEKSTLPEVRSAGVRALKKLEALGASLAAVHRASLQIVFDIEHTLLAPPGASHGIVNASGVEAFLGEVGPAAFESHAKGLVAAHVSTARATVLRALKFVCGVQAFDPRLACPDLATEPGALDVAGLEQAVKAVVAVLDAAADDAPLNAAAENARLANGVGLAGCVAPAPVLSGSKMRIAVNSLRSAAESSCAVSTGVRRVLALLREPGTGAPIGGEVSLTLTAPSLSAVSMYAEAGAGSLNESVRFATSEMKMTVTYEVVASEAECAAPSVVWVREGVVVCVKDQTRFPELPLSPYTDWVVTFGGAQVREGATVNLDIVFEGTLVECGAGLEGDLLPVGVLNSARERLRFAPTALMAGSVCGGTAFGLLVEDSQGPAPAPEPSPEPSPAPASSSMGLYVGIGAGVTAAALAAGLVAWRRRSRPADAAPLPTAEIVAVKVDSPADEPIPL